MKALLAQLCICVLAACAGEERDLPVAGIDCRTGLYRSDQDEALALTPQTVGGYRWRLLDGRTGGLTETDDGWLSTLGWTVEADGFAVDLGACGDDAIRFGPVGALQNYTRVPLEITETTFEHDGLVFTGRLIWPAGAERSPLAVHVHGSERWSAVRSNPAPYLLAAQGIASFVTTNAGPGSRKAHTRKTSTFWPPMRARR